MRAEVIKNLSEEMKASIWEAHYHGDDGRLSLSRSITGSSSSSASYSSDSISNQSNHSDDSSPYCSDEYDPFDDPGTDVDPDVC